jgi:diaminopimelate decarboxylase
MNKQEKLKELQERTYAALKELEDFAEANSELYVTLDLTQAGGGRLITYNTKAEAFADFKENYQDTYGEKSTEEEMKELFEQEIQDSWDGPYVGWYSSSDRC